MKKYNWAILGAGNIAREMATALNEVNGEIYGVYNHRLKKAEDFAKEFGVKHVFKDLDAMMTDENIDIIYIATPHNLHYETIKEAIMHGKHVLCEKAITINAQQLEEVMMLSKEKEVVIAEAMTLYHMPLYKKLREVIDQGVIGKVRMVQVNFGSCKEYDVTNRFFSKDLAGGALLDIGVYAVSFARYFMESAPQKVLTTAQYFETGVDEQSGIIMANDEAQMAVISLTMRAKQPKRGVITGEHGFIEVENYPRADEAKIVYTADGRVEKITIGETSKALNYEVKNFEDYISKKVENKELQLSLDVMRLLTEIREQWGFIYPFE